MVPNERMYSIKEVAGMLSVGRDTVARMIRNGNLKAVRLPRCGGRGKNTTYRIQGGSINNLIG